MTKKIAAEKNSSRRAAHRKKQKKTLNKLGKRSADERNFISLLPELPEKKLNNHQKMLKYRKYKRKLKVRYVLLIICVLFATMRGLDHFNRQRFNQQSPAVLTSETSDLAQLTFVGDIMFDRGAYYKSQHEGYDVFFNRTKELWQQSDIVMGNLESAVIKHQNNYTKNVNKSINLAMDPKGVKSMKQAGFNLVGLANNHIGDFGRKGMRNTLKVLEKNKLNSVGVGENIDEAFNYAIYEVNGIKFGVMAVTDIVPKGTSATKEKSGAMTSQTSAYLNLMRELAEKTDYAIAYMHWGEEITQKISKRQRQLGHDIIDAGIDMIVGMHPHILEPIENYHGGLILYSVGNFVFEQEQSRTKDSVVANLRVDSAGEMSLELVPLRIQNGVPTLTRNPFFKKRIYHQLGKYLPKADKEIKTDSMLVKNFGYKFELEGDKNEENN